MAKDSITISDALALAAINELKVWLRSSLNGGDPQNLQDAARTYKIIAQMEGARESAASGNDCSLILEGIERLEKLMIPVSQGFTDLQTAITALQTAVGILAAEDASVVTDIKGLTAQVAAGEPVTGDQLEALATGVNAAVAQVTGVSNDLQAAIAPPATTPPAASAAQAQVKKPAGS